MRYEWDVAQHDDLVIAGDLFERPIQIIARVFRVAGEPFLIGACDARGCPYHAGTAWIVSGPADERADRLFGFRPRGTFTRSCA
jgi:hypothetical protein